MERYAAPTESLRAGIPASQTSPPTSSAGQSLQETRCDSLPADESSWSINPWCEKADEAMYCFAARTAFCCWLVKAGAAVVDGVVTGGVIR